MGDHPPPQITATSKGKDLLLVDGQQYRHRLDDPVTKQRVWRCNWTGPGKTACYAAARSTGTGPTLEVIHSRIHPRHAINEESSVRVHARTAMRRSTAGATMASISVRAIENFNGRDEHFELGNHFTGVIAFYQFFLLIEYSVYEILCNLPNELYMVPFTVYYF